MKLLIVFFLPLALQISPHTGNRPLLSGPDTVKVATAGANNLVVIDSLRLYQATNDTLLFNSLQGTIRQSGENNKVTISTKNQKANNKQMTNKHQKTKNKQEISKSKNQITIRQSGNNNSVKINSR